MPYFSIPVLEDDRRTDLLSVLHYYLITLRAEEAVLKPDATQLKAVIDLLQKVQATKAQEKLNLSSEEFSILYSGAQYMMLGMTGTRGKAYVDRLLGDKQSEEIKKEQVEYFRDTCMYLVNECNSRFAELADFALLRNKVEKTLKTLPH